MSEEFIKPGIPLPAWGDEGSSQGGSVLPPFKFYTLVLAYDSTTESGEGRVYRCKDGQFERTHIVMSFIIEDHTDTETGGIEIVPGELALEEGASDEDISDYGQPWLSGRVYNAIVSLDFDLENLDTFLPLMVFLS